MRQQMLTQFSWLTTTEEVITAIKADAYATKGSSN